MENFNSTKIEQLTNNNYAIWSMKMEAILDARELYEHVILKEEPVKIEGDQASVLEYNTWSKKNKEAFGLIVLSLTAEQAIVYKGIKKAKEIWEALKLRFEGAVEDRKIDLVLELTKLKKKHSESIEEYLTRSQGLSRQINELGKQISERELVRYVVEGLPEKYETIVIALSTNRSISFVDLRQTLLNFEKTEQEKNTNLRAYRTNDRNKFKQQRLCYNCNKPGHLQKDCWFKKEDKNFHKEINRTPFKGGKKWNNYRKEQANVIEESKPNSKTESALTTHDRTCEDQETEWHLDSACTSHMTSNENWIVNKVEENKDVNVAEEGRSIESTFRGEIPATTVVENETSNIRLKNVLCVPKLRGNLMSVPSIVQNGNQVLLTKEGAYIYDENENLICQGKFTDNMFIVKLRPTKNKFENDEEKRGYIPEEDETKQTNYMEIDYNVETQKLKNEESVNEQEEKSDEGTRDEQDSEDQGADESTTITDVSSDNDETQTDSRRPTRNRRMPERYNDYEAYLANDETPSTFESAIKSDEKELWKEAMNDEINSMNTHEVWEPVKRPKNKKVIKSRWVFQIKTTSEDRKRYKARLVAVGSGQRQGIDYEENFSPVMKWDTLRTLLTIAASKNSVIKFYDVKTAYLNGNLDEEIYMEPPPGYQLEDNLVYLIKRSIYGLPQSGRCWYNKFNEILEKAGLRKLKSDPCVFTKREGKEYIHIGIYVDDFIILASSNSMIDKVIKIVQKNVQIKETTESKMFLGVNIEQKHNEIKLSQKNYLLKILEKFGMADCKPVKTPGISGDNYLDDYKDSKIFPQQKYQEAIGSIMYLVTGTRPDIAYTVSKLSQYNKDPREVHWVAVKRVLRYLKGTADYSLKLKANNGVLNASTDASWSTTADGKSFGGHLIKIGQSLVSWKSGKQKLVALSTMEAELISACDGVCAVKWVKFLLQELSEKLLISIPTKIETDSQALIDWVKNPKLTSRTRHINRKFYFIKDDVQDGEIEMRHRSTKILEADVMTKNLSSDIMSQHMVKLGISSNCEN